MDEDSPVERRRRGRVGLWLLGIVAALLALVGIAYVGADSGVGRRFLSDRIAEIAPQSGLRIRVGRIEGSIYKDAVLRDVRLYDPKGLFATIPEARLDWSPFDFPLRRRLTIDSLVIPTADMVRVPELNPGDPNKPILPDFDIRIGNLVVGRLNLPASITGRPEVASLRARAEIRTGTADVDIDARVERGDALVGKLLVAPDRGDFDIDGRLTAPRDGVIANLLGITRPVDAIVRGQGRYRDWRGTLLAESEGTSIARLQLGAQSGRYTAVGRVRPDLFVAGLPQRLTAGGAAIDLDGRFDNRRWTGRLNLVSAQLTLDGDGTVDLANNRLSGLNANLWLRQPQALVRNLTGQNVRLALRADGPFQGPRVDYRLTAAWAALGNIRGDAVVAQGEGIIGRVATRLPLSLRIARVSGIGAFAEQIVADLRAEGVVRIAGETLTTDLMRIRGRGIDGRIGLTANLRTGVARGAFDGALPGLEIKGLGRVDLVTSLTARRDGALAFGGRARATVRRLDNGFLRTLTGGLPVIEGDLNLGTDGVVRFPRFTLRSPLLNLTGSGLRRADGTFQLTGRGRHARYGPVVATLDGPISRPRVQLQLANPLPAAKLGNIRLDLVPRADGFDFTSSGQSLLGPYQAAGRILLSQGPVVIDIARLAVGDTVARGRVSVVAGGLVGPLTLAGGGLDGTVRLDVLRGIQRAQLALALSNARFPGPPEISVDRGRVDGTILFDPRGLAVQGRFDGTGVRYGATSFDRFVADANLIGGRGPVRASFVTGSNRLLSLRVAADVTPDRIRAFAAGTLARRPIRLVNPATLVKVPGGWRLEPADLVFEGGRVRVSGATTSAGLDVDATLQNLPLSLVAAFRPDLGLDGRVSGTVSYRGRGGLPTGSAQLNLRNLTRAGLTDGSGPVDVGLNAALSETGAAARAVVSRGGEVIGRAQARMAPLPRGGDIVARLTNAPLQAQLRYNGEAGVLWRLTGIDNLVLSGPLGIAADVTGTLRSPRIRGAMRTSDARFESIATGTIVNGISAIGRFDGSRLQLRNISGTTRGGGTVTGEGDIDLAAANGFGMDMRLRATRALLIERDDLTARVTGNGRLLSNGAGGTLSGNFVIDDGNYVLGRATAAEALPVINVIERNVRGGGRQRARPSTPWRLDVVARGTNSLHVTGMGLDSWWSTDVRVRGPVNEFGILGTAELDRGDYTFAGRRFELTTGQIRFTGATPVDPVLNIVAEDDISGIDAQVRVRGTGQRPEISFTSTPALPEDELLSRILFGSSITDISVTEAAQLGLALASLRSGGGGLDPINAIRRAAGLDRLRILPANTELGAGTSIAAGKYLTRRLFVEVITDGQGYSATRVEFQVTRWLAILAAISTLNNESINVRIKRDY